jgi:hypothetical protein
MVGHSTVCHLTLMYSTLSSVFDLFNLVINKYLFFILKKVNINFNAKRIQLICTLSSYIFLLSYFFFNVSKIETRTNLCMFGWKMNLT